MSVGHDGTYDFRPDAIIKLLALGDSAVGMTSSFHLVLSKKSFGDKIQVIGRFFRTVKHLLNC